MGQPKASIIISTYNQPEWLKKVLWSYEQQTEKDFEIIIADDGSKKETKDVISTFKNKSSLRLKHIWQKDEGFQKTKILNKAILKTSSPYLIFTDGDCIARQDFVQVHVKNKRKNYALSGGYFKLSQVTSQSIIKQDIETQDCFNTSWLLKNGVKRSFKLNKLNAFGFKEWLLNTFTPTKATFDGMNVSVWKKDILDINGFDERMQYGGEDRELGERLMNNGIKFKQIRYSAICLHLFHSRNYIQEDMILKNNEIRKNTRATKSVYTKFGIKKD